MFFWKRWRNRRRQDGAARAGNGPEAGTGTSALRHGGAGAGEDEPGEGTVELAGRRLTKRLMPDPELTVLALAERHGVDFASNCRRGTCARCRCLVLEGAGFMNEPNKAETLRLTPEEIAGGYRLGCQARVTGDGPVRIRHAPYF